MLKLHSAILTLMVVISSFILSACDLADLTSSNNAYPGPGGVKSYPAPATPSTLSATTNAPVAATLQKEFTLKVGQTAALQGEDFSIRLQSIASDSRCPKSVTCVRAGEVEVALVVRQKNADLPTLTLSTNEPRSKNKEAIGGYTVQLIAVNPYPERPEPKIAPEAYVVTLIVSKP